MNTFTTKLRYGLFRAMLICQSWTKMSALKFLPWMNSRSDEHWSLARHLFFHVSKTTTTKPSVQRGYIFVLIACAPTVGFNVWPPLAKWVWRFRNILYFIWLNEVSNLILISCQSHDYLKMNDLKKPLLGTEQCNKSILLLTLVWSINTAGAFLAEGRLGLKERVIQSHQNI